MSTKLGKFVKESSSIFQEIKDDVLKTWLGDVKDSDIKVYSNAIEFDFDYGDKLTKDNLEALLGVFPKLKSLDWSFEKVKGGANYSVLVFRR